MHPTTPSSSRVIPQSAWLEGIPANGAKRLASLDDCGSGRPCRALPAGERLVLAGEIGARLRALCALCVVLLIEQMAGARGKGRGLFCLQRGGGGRALLRRQAADGGPAMREGDGDLRPGARRGITMMTEPGVAGGLRRPEPPALIAQGSARTASPLGRVAGSVLNLCLVGCFGCPGFEGLAARPFRKPGYRSKYRLRPRSRSS
jgi:hypothetical protein